MGIQWRPMSAYDQQPKVDGPQFNSILDSLIWK